MNILDKIVAAKKHEVEINKKDSGVKKLEKSPFFKIPSKSLFDALNNKAGSGIIAEFKRKSPSKGNINPGASPVMVCPGYLNAGASALSILTNHEFFGGSDNDLLLVRELCDGPILRKEFIIDEYQIVEAKSIGADAILLIVDILSAEELKSFFKTADKLGLEVLFELHDRQGIDKLPDNVKIAGINSRNLKTFKTDSNYLTELVNELPENCLKVAESGIDSAETVIRLEQLGFKGFLIGELFMKHSHPEQFCKEFIDSVNSLKLRLT